MSEWHLPPDYIVSNWTDELLNRMVDKLTERKERERKPKSEPVESEALFKARTSGSGFIKWETKHGD